MRKSIELEYLVTDVDAVEETATPTRRVTGRIPRLVYLVCLVELAERGSYYGITSCLTNFIQRPLPAGSSTGASATANPGALGLGLQWANSLYLLLIFAAYLAPIYGGYMADSRFGKYRAVWIGVLVSGVSHLGFVLAAWPFLLVNYPEMSLVATVASILTLAIGVGFIKPNLLPLVLDQYPHTEDYVLLVGGERVLVDHKATLEKISLVFYWSINIGCFFQFATVMAEKRYGYWLAFSIPGAMYLLLPVILWLVGPKLVKHPVEKGSILRESLDVLRECFQPGWFQRWRHNRFWISQSALAVDLQTTVESCKVFAYFIIFNVNDSSLNSLQTNQAGSLSLNGVPNDFFGVFNPLTIVLMIPFQDYVLYPLLRRFNLPFSAKWKIITGFVMASLGSLIAAVLQQRIYETSPCGAQASTCDTPSSLSGWWTAPSWILPAMGECFSNVTAYELAYSQSPVRMKSVVLALFLATTSLSAVLGELTNFWARDPYLVWPFAIFGVLGLATSVDFIRRDV